LFSWTIVNPTAGSGIPGPQLREAHTGTRISSYVTAATSVAFNIEERGTIGAAGTDLLAADQTATTTGATTTTLSNPGLAADCWLWLDISAVTDTPAILVVTLATTV
jgi:hypothetical protein